MSKTHKKTHVACAVVCLPNEGKKKSLKKTIPSKNKHDCDVEKKCFFVCAAIPETLSNVQKDKLMTNKAKSDKKSDKKSSAKSTNFTHTSSWTELNTYLKQIPNAVILVSATWCKYCPPQFNLFKTATSPIPKFYLSISGDEISSPELKIETVPAFVIKHNEKMFVVSSQWSETKRFLQEKFGSRKKTSSTKKKKTSRKKLSKKK